MTSQMNKVSAAHFNHALLPSPHLSYYFLWPWEESSAGFDFPPFAASLPSFLIIEPNFLLWAFFLPHIWWGSSGISWVLGVSKRWWQWSGRKKGRRLFHFEGHFLPGHDGSAGGAAKCLCHQLSPVRQRGEHRFRVRRGTKVPKKARTTFLMYAKARSGGVNTVSPDWICLLQHFILISLEQRSWLLLLISNWIDLCHFPFSILFDSSLWCLLSNIHFYFLIARPCRHCPMQLASFLCCGLVSCVRLFHVGC